MRSKKKTIGILIVVIVVLLGVFNMNISLRINSSAEDSTSEYAEINVITNNKYNTFTKGAQTSADLIANKSNKITLIKNDKKIYMSLDDICKATRTNKEKSGDNYILKQGSQEIIILMESDGNAKLQSYYGYFDIQTLTENGIMYCEPEPLMSMLFAECIYSDNDTLLIDMPEYTVYEATDFDYSKYVTDVVISFGMDENDNLVTGLMKWGLVIQRVGISLVSDIVVNGKYGFFATDNTTKQYFFESFNEVLGYDIYSNKAVKEEETNMYKKINEIGSFLEKTSNGDISDTPFTNFYINSYIDSYAQNGAKDHNSLSLFNDTIRDLAENGREEEKLSLYLNKSGKDVLTRILFNSALEYLKRSSYDRNILKMFNTLYSEDTVNKYNISLNENGQFYFQCARDYYNSCDSFGDIVKEVTLNESLNKFAEMIIQGLFSVTTAGQSQEVFETYETILTAEKLRESNKSYKPIEKIENSTKYFSLAKMQESTMIVLEKIAEQANKSVRSEDIGDLVTSLDFYNRISAVMIKTLADSYQLPTTTEREKDLIAHKDEYINDLCLNIYKLEHCEYDMPTKEDLDNKNCDVFEKFFTPIEPTTVPTEPIQKEIITGTVNTEEDKLNVRKSPSTDSEIIGKLEKGSAVKVYSETDGWYEIEYNGGIGYVSKDFIKINENNPDNNAAEKTEPTAAQTEPASVISEGTNDISALSLGNGCSGCIDSNGNLYMWGDNLFGKLGTGTANDSSIPIKIMDNVKEVNLGYYRSSAITNDGSLYMWGSNEHGGLGDGTSKDSSTPIKIMDNVKYVFVGYEHNAAITEDDSLYMWGSNKYGKLGNGTTNDSLTPIKIMDNVKAVSLGSEYSGAITEDGSLYMWGGNWCYQLGNGTKKDSLTPVKIMDNVKNITIGNCHNAAITEDGSLYMWGYNGEGQLGNETTNSSPTPIKIMDNVKSVSLGSEHSGAITEDGCLYMWGDNFYNQLGYKTAKSSTPTKVMDNIKSISLVGSQSSAITEDNILYMWGRETNVTVDNVLSVSIGQFSYGNNHYGIIKTDGNLYMWGDNTFGEIGNGESGTYINISTPTKIEIN